MHRHFCGKGFKFGSSEVPLFWKTSVNVDSLSRSACGIRMKLGKVKEIRLEDVLPWARMKPLRDNPGDLVGMWAKSPHKALVILIVEVRFSIIGEEPNEFDLE